MRTPLGVPQYTMIMAWLVIGPVLWLIAMMPFIEPWQEPWMPVPNGGRPARSLAGASTVLRPDSGARLFPLCSRPDPGFVMETWQPDSATVAQLEGDLAKVIPLLHFRYQRSEDSVALGDYDRQYIGISTFRHARLIYINAIADPEWFPDWTVSAAQVCDGGDALWGLEYDPFTRRFRGFVDNGSA